MIKKIFESKQNIVKECRESWPLFASFEEDKEFSDEKYVKRYHDKKTRPVFWDMTNVKIPKPSESNTQRATYSSYYAQNCVKGGIGVQTCGWVRLHDLWMGWVSDTAYQERSGIFDMQKKFGESDLVDEKYIAFRNILDKGYRNRLAAWRAGRQLTLHPTFARSDQRFRRGDTLSLAIIASDRSGNERAVCLSKMSGYISRGLEKHQGFNGLHYTWLTWGFQLNFMFSPVM